MLDSELDKLINGCTVHFFYGTMPVASEYELNYPYCLQNAKITQIRKLFDYMCHYEQLRRKENQEAIRKTAEMLDPLIELMKMDWKTATEEFNRGYKLPPDAFAVSISPETAKLKKIIDSNNKKLLNACKKAKHEYERMLKIKKLFCNSLDKYQVRETIGLDYKFTEE